MQINSFPLLRTTSDRGVPRQSNPFNVPSCLSPLLSFPVLPAESYGRWGGGCGLVARGMREETHSNEELGSWGSRGKEGGVCVQVQLCGKRLEPGGRITSSDSVVTSCVWPRARGGIHTQSNRKWMLEVMPILPFRFCCGVFFFFFRFFTLANWHLNKVSVVSGMWRLEYRSLAARTEPTRHPQCHPKGYL